MSALAVHDEATELTAPERSAATVALGRLLFEQVDEAGERAHVPERAADHLERSSREGADARRATAASDSLSNSGERRE
jgi:hypothetical protein